MPESSSSVPAMPVIWLVMMEVNAAFLEDADEAH